MWDPRIWADLVFDSSMPGNQDCAWWGCVPLYRLTNDSYNNYTTITFLKFSQAGMRSDTKDNNGMVLHSSHILL